MAIAPPSTPVPPVRIAVFPLMLNRLLMFIQFML
jgi:hypothetical protein